MHNRSLIDVTCICMGHVRKVPLISGQYDLRCPIGGYFKVVIEHIADIEWKITRDTKTANGRRTSITQRRYFVAS